MSKFEKYIKLAKSKGVDKVKIIDPKTVVTGNWVRLKCQFGCGGYGERLTCPPYSPMPEYTAESCRYPEKARPSMEACGIDVYKTVRNNGWKLEVVRSEQDLCSIVSLILIE